MRLGMRRHFEKELHNDDCLSETRQSAQRLHMLIASGTRGNREVKSKKKIKFSTEIRSLEINEIHELFLVALHVLVLRQLLR